MTGLVMLATETAPSTTATWLFAIRAELNWSLVELGVAGFILTSVGLLLGPVVGFLGDRVISVRRMVVAGLIVLAGAFFLLSQTQNLLMYFFTAALLGMSGAMAGWILLMTVICRWFVRYRATAIGLAHMVSRFGPILLVPLIFYGSEWSGWRLTAIVLGEIVLVIAVVAQVWLRNRPEEMGLLPNGATGAIRQRSFSVLQAMRTRAFWFIALADGLAAAELLDLVEFTSAYTEGSVAVVSMALVSLVFLLVGGLAGDRFSKRVVLVSFAVLQVVGLLVASFSGNLATLTVAAVLLGMSEGGRIPVRVAILADYFGTDSLATILGVFGLVAGVITLAAGPLAGSFYDAREGPSGTLVLAAVPLLAALLFWTARPTQRPSPDAPVRSSGPKSLK